MWYMNTMKTSIDKAGRVVIPAPVRARLGLTPGTELEVDVQDFAIRIARSAPRPKLVKQGRLLVARPTADLKRAPRVDVARLIEEERDRWP